MSTSAARRRLLLNAGALCLSGLGLAGCAGRKPEARRRAPPPKTAPAPSHAQTGASPVPALRPGAKVAIVAPASAARNASDLAAQWLEDRGFVAQIMPASRVRLDSPYEYLAGTDQQRLDDLHAAFAAPDIGAVWCLQGGFGSWRLLDQLDFGLLRQHPKPFIGYSDITALHLAMQRHAGFVTFHGPMLAQDLLAGKREPTESHLLAMVGGQVGQGAWIEPPPLSRPVELVAGTASGRLVGGNLALIAALTGTPNEIDTEGAILFFEDVNEALPRVDRLLSQLAAAGKFEGIRGVLVGNFTRILGTHMDDAQAQSLLYPLVLEQFGALGIPVLAGWPSGHGDPNLTLPLGANITLDTARAALRLDQPITVAG
ncbi:LD-carboxypeptidase family protein [Achromobacter arsenitoxydans SY8]|uniref:LD-carboxypeptidase family protein n=1 Tax=Achromobacter arsenitoxydans SY8 TaxID=477184 RepID=H0F805_9BURK|nr:LD-carboxypeptidase family protein [Achromobacter arsenitoxydans SY8]